MEASSSRAEDADGSGLMLRVEMDWWSIDSSSVWETSDWLRVRARADSAIVEEAALSARPPRPLVVAAYSFFFRGTFLRAPSFRGSVGASSFFRSRVPLVSVCRASGEGDGAFSLIGLISLEPGRVGE